MMNLRQLDTSPGWKRFLLLGERLLSHSSVSEQCDLISQTAEEWLKCKASVWLAAPFYPLPGEGDDPVLPEAPAPSLVLEALHNQQMICSEIKCLEEKSNQCQIVYEAAAPIMSQNNLLGVLHAARAGGPVFSDEELNTLDGIVTHAALSMEITRQAAIKNWRSEQLTLVRSVSAQIANLLDLDELCHRVIDLIQRKFNYYYVAIFTLDTQNQILQFRTSASREPAWKESSLPIVQLGDGMIGTAGEMGKEVLAQRVENEPSYRAFETLPRTRSEIALPLKVENRVLGVLDVQSDKHYGFHDVDLLVLRSLADNISLAIEGTHLYDALQKRADQISLVLEISHILNSILDLDELLEKFVQLIHKRFGYPFVHVYTVHPIRRKIIYQAGSGTRSHSMQETGLTYDLDDPKGIIPWVARNGKTYLAKDVLREALYRDYEFQPNFTRSELTIPIAYAGEVQGVLDVQSNQLNVFDENDRHLLESIASSIAIAMRNANLFRSERWRRQVADSFREIAELVSANIAIDALLDKILVRLEKNLPCEASAIWLVDNSQDGQLNNLEQPQLRLAAVHGTTPEKVIAAVQKSGISSGFLKAALQKSFPVIRKPDSPFGPLGSAMSFPQNYSSIAAPMRAGNQILGILTLAHHTSSRYGSEAQDITSTFASYAAVAIQNARLFSQAQEQSWVSTVLLQVSEATQCITTVKDLFETLVHLTPMLIGVNKCAIFVCGSTQQTYTLEANYGFEAIGLGESLSEKQAPVFERLRTTLSAVFIRDLNQEMGIAVKDNGEPETVVMLPILAREELLGAFLVTHIVTGQTGAKIDFDERALLVLQGIVRQAAVTFENLRLNEARQEESYVTAILLQVAQAIARQSTLDDILETIIHLLPILVGIDTAVIYLWEPKEKTYRPLEAFSVQNSDKKELLKKNYQPGDYELLDRVITENQPFFCPFGQANPALEEWPHLCALPATELSSPGSYSSKHWLLGIPLSVKGETYGVLVTEESSISPRLRGRRMEIISGIAQQIALAIQNERLTQEMVARERLEREVQLARQIQKTFLPDQLPLTPGWEVGARWETARSVGGDFYDIFFLDSQHLVLAIADVSDKGLPAALYMTVTRTLIRANAHTSHSPAEILKRVNDQLIMDSQNGMFVTAVLIILDVETGKLLYANTGHNLPLVVRQKENKVQIYPKGGIALGVIENIKPVDYELSIQPGDLLVLYTDGVTETFSPEEEPFGEERLIQFLHEQRTETVNQIMDRLDNLLTNFRAGSPPSDDLTILAIRRNASTKE
jgi:phosphoserine phosphatase RsbU/P